MNRPRIVRRLVLILAAVLLLPLLLVGVGFGWLGTDAGERWLREQGVAELNNLLSDSGLSLSAAALSGPLPGRLAVRGVVLSDRHGPWLTLAEAEIVLNLRRIVRGRLDVTSVMAKAPVLLRLPDLPPSPDQSEFDLLALTHDIPDWLPAVRVKNLTVRGLRVPAKLLDPAAAEDASLDFDMDGTLAVPVYTELRTMLDIRRTAPDSDHLRLEAGLSVTDQMLDLRVSLSESEGGLLQAFVPELRGLNVTLTGKAPLRNWTGELSLDAPGLGRVQGPIQAGLPASKISVSDDSSPARQLGLDLALTPDASLPAPWPALLGQARLTLSAVMAPGRIELSHADVLLPGLAVTANLRGLRMEETAGNPAEHSGFSGPAKLSGEIRLSADITRFPDGLPRPPFDAATVFATLSGTLQSPELTLETRLSGLHPDTRFPPTDALIQSRLALNADTLNLHTGLSADMDRFKLNLDAALSGAPVGRARTGVFPDVSTPAAMEVLLRELGLSLTASVEAAPDALKNLDLSAPDATGFTAGLTVRLDYPTARVSLNSPGVRMQEQAWSNLRVDMELAPPEQTPPSPMTPSPMTPSSSATSSLIPALKASASLTTPYGPVRMDVSGAWREHLVHISSLTAEGAGLRLSGQVRAMLDDAARMDGRFSLRVANWSALAPLLPVPLSAGSAVVDLRLAPEQNQSAELSLQITDLVVPGPGTATPATYTTSGTATDTVTLGSLNLSGKATDLFTSPRLSAALNVGAGRAASTVWQAFTVQMKARMPGVAPALSELEIAANLVNVTAEGLSAPPLNMTVTGGLARDGKRFKLELHSEGLGLEPINGLVQVPVSQRNGLLVPDMTAPLSGYLRWQGQLGPLWLLVPVANCRVRGEGFVDLTLAGTLARPRPGGSIRLENMLFQELTQALELSHMHCELLFSPTGPASVKVTGNGGRAGDFSFSGTVGVFDPQLPLDVRGQFNRVAPFLRQDLRVSISGEAGVRGVLVRPEVFADLTVNSGELQVEKLPGGGVTTLDVVNAEVGQSTPSTPAIFATSAPSATTPAFDPAYTSEETDSEAMPPAVAPETGLLNVTVTVPNRFYVRGHGLESEWGGKLRVTGPFDAPRVNGQLASVRGTMSFLGKLFVLSKGEISFDGGSPPRPMLNVQVTYSRQDFTALIELMGLATNPRLRLSSQPSLPTGDIVAQILFGSTAAGLGRAEAIQLGATLASLTLFNSKGGSIVDITRDSLGLDVLRVGSRRGLGSSTSDNLRNFQPFGNTGLGQSGAGAAGLSRENAPDTENALALEVGKYVLDNVYVGVEQGMEQDSTGVVVDIEMTPSVNLEAKTTGRGTEVGVIWSWDY